MYERSMFNAFRRKDKISTARRTGKNVKKTGTYSLNCPDSPQQWFELFS